MSLIDELNKFSIGHTKMYQIKYKIRHGVKDVFNTFLYKKAKFDGKYEFPIIKSIDIIPNELISFSKAKFTKNYNQWIHFFEDDYKFIQIQRSPKRYLNFFKKFNGIIAPDFSIYRDLPFGQQIMAVLNSRAIAHWLQINGVNVIPNITWGDERTYEFCCDGIEKNSIIATGSLGCLKNKREKKFFVKGLDYVVNQLKPKAIIIYGRTPTKIFDYYRMLGIEIISFDSDISKTFKNGGKNG